MRRRRKDSRHHWAVCELRFNWRTRRPEIRLLFTNKIKLAAQARAKAHGGHVAVIPTRCFGAHRQPGEWSSEPLLGEPARADRRTDVAGYLADQRPDPRYLSRAARERLGLKRRPTRISKRAMARREARKDAALKRTVANA